MDHPVLLSKPMDFALYVNRQVRLDPQLRHSTRIILVETPVDVLDHDSGANLAKEVQTMVENWDFEAMRPVEEHILTVFGLHIVQQPRWCQPGECAGGPGCPQTEILQDLLGAALAFSPGLTALHLACSKEGTLPGYVGDNHPLDRLGLCLAGLYHGLLGDTISQDMPLPSPTRMRIDIRFRAVASLAPTYGPGTFGDYPHTFGLPTIQDLSVGHAFPVSVPVDTFGYSPPDRRGLRSLQIVNPKLDGPRWHELLGGCDMLSQLVITGTFDVDLVGSGGQQQQQQQRIVDAASSNLNHGLLGPGRLHLSTVVLPETLGLDVWRVIAGPDARVYALGREGNDDAEGGGGITRLRNVQVPLNALFGTIEEFRELPDMRDAARAVLPARSLETLALIDAWATVEDEDAPLWPSRTDVPLADPRAWYPDRVLWLLQVLLRRSDFPNLRKVTLIPRRGVAAGAGPELPFLRAEVEGVWDEVDRELYIDENLGGAFRMEMNEW